MLSLIIPRPRSVTGVNFDVYLGPLLRELMVLWQTGIECFDGSRRNGETRFNLRAMPLWTIHDFPAYGIVAGCLTKGFKACPICGPNTKARYSSALHKCVYDNQHCMWLPPNHPYRSSTAFDGLTENKGNPTRMSGEDTIYHGRMRETFVANGGAPAREDPARVYGINRVSALFRLSYWQVSPSSVTHFSAIVTNLCPHISRISTHLL